VVPTSRPVAIPGVPPFVSGVVNLSGRIVVQMNVAELLGRAEARPQAARPAGQGAADDERPRCVVLKADGLLFALVAEEVAGLMEITPAKLNAPARAEGLTRESFALAEKVVSIVDVAAVLARAEAAVGER
jgi:chemotaxis signal transduction protein